MLEEIYALIGYDDVFGIKHKEVREYTVSKAHNRLMSILMRCKELGIISKINEDKLDEIEDWEE